METKTIITVESNIKFPLSKIWLLWTEPEHVVNWNFATDDWHCPHVENDVKTGGKFKYRMEAKDGSAAFDFTGEYKHIELHSTIEYTLDDGREVTITFSVDGDQTIIKESFEAETINSIELQKTGWQQILDNFKKYAESFGAIESMKFEAEINRDTATVYKTMLDKEHFKEWTAEFNPSSYYEGSWTKGAIINFLGIDDNENSGGMVGLVKENIPNKFVCVEYKAIISNGKETTTGPEADDWIGGLENYTYVDKDGKTLLTIELVAKFQPESKAYFAETYPKALNILKLICESKK